MLFFLQSLRSPIARRHIESVKVFGKSGEHLVDISVSFRCYCCHPFLIPEQPPEFATLSATSAVTKEAYANEFHKMKQVVLSEVRSLKRTNVDNRVNAANPQRPSCQSATCSLSDLTGSWTDMSDEEEVEEEEDDLRIVANFSEAEEEEEKTRDEEVEEKKCPHRASFNMRQVKFRDSYDLIRGSLQKTSTEMVQSAVQRTSCREFASSAPESEINLGPPKLCNCCRDLNHIPSLCPDLLHFSETLLGSRRHVDVLTTKIRDFPYSVLDHPIDELRVMPIPSDKRLFKNDLKDGEEITDQRLQQFLSMCRNLGFKTALDMICGYLFVDVLVLATLLQFSALFLSKTFGGINLLEYASVSRLGFDLLLEDACRQVGGREGVAFISNYTEFLKWSNGRFGGFNTCSDYGKSLVPNNFYQPSLDYEKMQSILLAIDKTTHYGTALESKMPWTEHAYHGPGSTLVKSMNELVCTRKFVEHYKRPNAMRNTYFLVECTISFPEAAQDRLKYFVPVIRRRTISRCDLSSYQNSQFEKFGLKMDEKSEINVSDFADQRQSLSMEYLLLLKDLGVEILEVHSVLSAYATPIFAPIVRKLLKMKCNEPLSFKKSWFKLLVRGGGEV